MGFLKSKRFFPFERTDESQNLRLSGLFDVGFFAKIDGELYAAKTISENLASGFDAFRGPASFKLINPYSANSFTSL
jgi:hypothetical protein